MDDITRQWNRSAKMFPFCTIMKSGTNHYFSVPHDFGQVFAHYSQYLYEKSNFFLDLEKHKLMDQWLPQNHWSWEMEM